MIIASCEFREMTVWTKVTQNWLSTRVVKTENPKVFLFLYCTYFGHKNKILEFFSDSKRRFSMSMVIFFDVYRDSAKVTILERLLSYTTFSDFVDF